MSYGSLVLVMERLLVDSRSARSIPRAELLVLEGALLTTLDAIAAELIRRDSEPQSKQRPVAGPMDAQRG